MQTQPQTINQAKLCAHCGLPVPGRFLDSQSRDACEIMFCCSGCAVVYQFLKDNNLDAFYDIRERVSEESKQPANVSGSSFEAYDDPLFYDAHVRTSSNGLRQVTLYLADMHCAACVWLLEKLPEILAGVNEAKANFGRSLITVQFNSEKIKLSKIAQTLNTLGYPPRALPNVSEQRGTIASKSMLIRLGVAGVAAGNSMMLAISLYQGYFTGMEERYRLFFEVFSLLITTPAVFYSAMPFYRAAWQGLRRGMLHIDLPISIGILGGYVASVVQLLLGNPHIYFDSISMLIFLLLGGRIVQRASIDCSINTKTILSTFMPISAKQKSAEGFAETYIESLKAADVIQVAEREVIPVDGVVQLGKAAIDCALLTGESTALLAETGTPVFAGTTVLSGNVEILVHKVGQETRLGRLMELIEQADAKKTKIQSLTDKISGVFVVGVIVLAFATAIYFLATAHWSLALERTLALLIVSCPCALGMAAPLAFATAIRRAASNGVLVRDVGALEQIAKITAAVFDKTGTLTKRLAMVQSCYVFSHSNNQWEKLESQSGQDIDSNLFSCVLSLEAQVSHPIATSIVSYLQSLGVCEKEAPTTIHRLAGVGVSGSWGNKSNLSLVSQVSASKYMEFSKIKLPLDLIWELEAASQSVVVAILDQQPAAIFGIENAIKQSAKSLIEYCKQHEISCSLLSGDTAQLTEKIGTELGLPEGQALGGCSPEAKVSFIEELKKQHTVMMVGDGANDAGALRTADVGVAMGGGAELSLAAAPVFLATDQPRTVMELITGAKNTISTVRLNIGISVCYNTVGATLAILGYINPLVAAVLMPLSSLSVVAISLLRPSFQKKS